MKKLQAVKEFAGAPNGYDTRLIAKGEVFDGSDAFAVAAIAGKQCKLYKEKAEKPADDPKVDPKDDPEGNDPADDPEGDDDSVFGD